jgi:hypothetical protein
MKDFLNNDINPGDIVIVFNGNDGRHSNLGVVVGNTKTMMCYVDGQKKWGYIGTTYKQTTELAVHKKMPAYTVVITKEQLGNYSKASTLLELDWQSVAATFGTKGKSVDQSKLKI